jgi:hypothetical protein
MGVRARRWLTCAALMLLAACGRNDRDGVQPIPDWLFFPSEAVTLIQHYFFGGAGPVPGPVGEVERRRPIDFAQPIPHVRVPQHPFMAANVGSNMHDDAYMSDTYEAAGPRGVAPLVRSRSRGFGGYGTLAFDRSGRMVGVYSNGRGFRLEWLDADSLTLLAKYDLPSRPWYWPLQGIWPWEYIGAGMYFYLDQEDRAIVPTTRNTIEVVQVPQGSGNFRRLRRYDLNNHVVQMRWPQRDSVAWVLPDWKGRHYWYATTAGMVGTVDTDSGAVHTRQLAGEIVENSFAVGEEGVFIISDHALYRFHLDATQGIVTDWRTAYERGSGRKPGHITRGSGTSVTLVGDAASGQVVVTDNAEPQIHLLFVHRSDGRVACSTPLFPPGQSGTDISAIAFEQAAKDSGRTGRYSAIVENNWGHNRFPVAHPAGGLVRVDAFPQSGSTYECRTVWTSPETNIGVFKLSFGSGLVYTYFRNEREELTQWYLTAIDYRSGETVYRTRVGAGEGYNNWAGALFLHPNGAAYSTTIFGLVMIRDSGGGQR